MLQWFITAASVLVAFASLSLWAVEKHADHGASMDHSAMTNNIGHPTEGGQATFSALIEIVAILEGDADTDWEKVNIDGLRSHLLDMNDLILDTSASTVLVDSRKIRFDITGSSASVPAIHRMVPAHSRFLQQSRGWTIVAALSDDGATVSISVESDSELNRLSALGFYGFMALDSHHQAHHYQMAVGQSH